MKHHSFAGEVSHDVRQLSGNELNNLDFALSFRISKLIDGATLSDASKHEYWIVGLCVHPC